MADAKPVVDDATTIHRFPDQIAIFETVPEGIVSSDVNPKGAVVGHDDPESRTALYQFEPSYEYRIGGLAAVLLRFPVADPYASITNRTTLNGFNAAFMVAVPDASIICVDPIPTATFPETFPEKYTPEFTLTGIDVLEYTWKGAVAVEATTS
jgi:hypothetical protein